MTEKFTFTQSAFEATFREIVAATKQELVNTNSEIATEGAKNVFELALRPILDQAFKQGYCSAVDDYAIWNDGEQTIGSQRTNVKEIYDRVMGAQK